MEITDSSREQEERLVLSISHLVRPGVPDLHTIETRVTIYARLVIYGRATLVYNRVQDIRVPQASASRAAPAEQPSGAVRSQTEVRKRPRKARNAVVEQRPLVVGVRGSVVDHKAVYGAPGPLVVAVVRLPVPILRVRNIPLLELGKYLGRGHGLSHQSPL